MARETPSVIGSGYYNAVYPIIPSGQGGSGPATGSDQVRSQLGGSNVVIVNPENVVAVPAWNTSGVSVGVVPTKIWDANINYILPTQRLIRLQNMGPNEVRVSSNPTGAIFPSGFTITPITAAATNKDNTSRLDLPLMKGAEIWASSLGTSQIQIIIY